MGEQHYITFHKNTSHGITGKILFIHSVFLLWFVLLGFLFFCFIHLLICTQGGSDFI